MRKIEAIEELAKYCISCPKKPCQNGCPLKNDTTEFIRMIKENKYKQAYEILCETTVLQSICGRICPHSKQCQGSCIRGIKSNPVEIGKMEAFIGDLAIKNNWKIPMIRNEKTNKKIAVIGGGPSGLTCAAFLARMGHTVTIIEKHNYLGGLLIHGIPEFRLKKSIVKEVINKILELGIKVELEKELGKKYSLEEIKERYDAVFLSFGANISTKMNIEGENLKGVFGGNEILENGNHPNYKNKKVFVIGGGNVAMDVSRTIKKLGAKEVTILYRRSEEQLPAEIKEIDSARKEDIKFVFQTNITKILGNKNVEKIECVKTKLIKKESEERLVPVNIENSEFTLEADYVIMALGSEAQKDTLDKMNLELNSKGYIKVNEKLMTSEAKIFAGGDLVQTKNTVAWASKTGRDAAIEIDKYIKM